MINIEEFINGDALFDGHYRLLRQLNVDNESADTWLAIDVSTIDNFFTQYEDGGHVVDESAGLQVVLKIYRIDETFGDEGEQRFRKAYKIVQGCRHANLLQPIDLSFYRGVPYLVFPYCEAGSAEKLIGEKMSNTMLWKFISDVASGLEALHNHKPQIVHRDLKPSNILIDENGSFVLSDYGIGVNTNNELSHESDIWAFGATLYEILSGNVLFGKNGNIMQAAGSANMPDMKEIPSSVRSLVSACLQSDPKKRPTAQQIVEAAQKKRFATKQKKPVWSVIVAVASILFIGGIIAFFVTKEKPNHNTESKILVEEKVNYYEKAVVLLSEMTTANKGIRILDSLVSENDFQATFLMSRLYFEPMNERDKVFYNPTWRGMRYNSGIHPDNGKAHELLLKALWLNQDDYVTLYELGCDYMAPNEQRGTAKNLNYAKWCFLHAEAAAKASQNVDATRYLVTIEELSDRIKHHEIQNDTVIQPIKPQQ